MSGNQLGHRLVLCAVKGGRDEICKLGRKQINHYNVFERTDHNKLNHTIAQALPAIPFSLLRSLFFTQHPHPTEDVCLGRG